MSYEIKVLLIAIAKILSRSEDVAEAYGAIAEMANVEGVIIKSYEEEKKKQS